MLALLPAALAVVYTLLCPGTKVEESFNVQAVHDVLFHGADLPRYDHFEFPGVVPRTFLGPLALAGPLAPFAAPAAAAGVPKVYFLLAARVVLAAVLWSGFGRFVGAVRKACGATTATCLVVVTSVQFHYLFYSSRTLPNTFASAMSTFAWQCRGWWNPRRSHRREHEWT